MKARIEIATVLVCLLGSAASAVLFSLPPCPTSELQVLPATTQSLGVVRQGASARATFELRNCGTRRIRLLGVRTSCGCAVSELSAREIQPKDSATLALTYESGEARGPINFSAVLLFQPDGDKPLALTLELHGEVDPDYGVAPERLEFEEGVSSAQRVVLWPRRISTLKVHKVQCDKRFFEARIVDAETTGEQAVEVAFQAKGYYPEAGPASLAIFTDSERQPTLLVPLLVRSRLKSPTE